MGLGPAVDENPFVAARLPTIEALLDGRGPFQAAGPNGAGPNGAWPNGAGPYHGTAASLVGIDATHGAPGIPQSGTGHTTLLTGEDAVKLFGRHYGPWVPTSLRTLVAERSILARAREAGRTVAFANAYPEEAMAGVPADSSVPLDVALRSRRLGPLRSGPPLAALGAGVLTRHTPELQRGEAVASEITNDGWIERLGRTSLPRPSPQDAGRSLARIAALNDLTLFAHYSTDYVGHRGTWDEAVAALEKLDAFLGGVLEGLPEDMLLILASDHGNIEDSTREHTRNPALGLVAGPGHGAIAPTLGRLQDVPAAILTILGIAGEIEGSRR